MSEAINQTLVLGVIALLLIWLIYRIRSSVRRLIEKEIFRNFPTVKDTIDNYQRRLEYLKIEIELLEKRISGLKSQAK
ncbi:MAG: hypothetical protein AMJ95_12935 [Omnitrophica WOR_2 bacterium SM23_72]|nr:MAG: hypothetical protein AMJ95_12935 [Omnitrophica WOR_2 bacterium SM23_72]